jgi:PAS domain-containing protein
MLRAGLPGEITAWAETLHDGPTPYDVTDDEWRRTRAHFYEECGWGTFPENLDRLERWDEPLSRADTFDEVVLWFEHDLFDQLILIRLLWWFHRQGIRVPMSLVCIDHHEGITRFLGLGQLTPDRFRPLYQRRTPNAEPQVQLACGAWEAFTADEPRRLEAFLASDTTALPFLASDLRRHLEDFPGLGDGLARSEREPLRAIDAGRTQFVEVFRHMLEAEPAPYLGDNSLDCILKRLAVGPKPLVTIDGPAWYRSEFTLTPAGRLVLDGQADWLALNPAAERWLGGVRVGGAYPWRWDAAAGRIIGP